MKSSISFALLCFLLSLENASALMGFSFANLLFGLNFCHKNHITSTCQPNCKLPMLPKDRERYCGNQCLAKSNSTCYEVKQQMISSGKQIDPYYMCETDVFNQCNSNSEGSDYDADSFDITPYIDGGTSSYDGTPPVASRVSLLPYFVAASVSTVFLALYAWKKKKQREELRNEQLLGSDDSFHGSVARRIQHVTTFNADALDSVKMVNAETGYEYATA